MPEDPLLLDFVFDHDRRRKDTRWIGWLFADREAAAHFLSAAVFSNSRDHFIFHPTMSQTTTLTSFIPDLDFHSFRQEIQALPLRKRAKWRGCVQDTDGVNHRVYFINGEFVFKDRSEWIALEPDGMKRYWDIPNYQNPRLEGQYRRIDRAYEIGGPVAVQQEHDRLVAENATGNHSSKPHKIRVPTKAGEPVRA